MDLAFDDIEQDNSEYDSHQDILDAATEDTDPESIWKVHEETLVRPRDLGGYFVALAERLHGSKWEVQVSPIGAVGDRDLDFDGEKAQDPRQYVGTQQEAREMYNRCVEDLHSGLVPDPRAYRHMRGPIEASTVESACAYRNNDGSWDGNKIMTRGHEIARSLDEDRDYIDRLSNGMTQAWAEAKQESAPADTTIDAGAAKWRSDNTAIANDARDRECGKIEADMPRRSLKDVSKLEKSGEDWRVTMRERGGRTWTLYLYCGEIIAGHPRRDAYAARGDAKRFITTFDRMSGFEEARGGFSDGGCGVSADFAIEEFRRSFRKGHPNDFEQLKQTWDLGNPDLDREVAM